MTTDRRLVLTSLSRRAAALAWASVFGGGISACAARVEPLKTAGHDPFTLGVASGRPRPRSVVIWTRLAPRPQEPGGGLPDRLIPVFWQVSDDDRFAHVAAHGVTQADGAQAHSVHVDVDGLDPGRHYFYRFIAGDAVSPIGRTRTAPAVDEDTARLRLALMSCQHYEQGAYVAHREVARADLDVVVFVGDYVYESSNPLYRRRQHEASAPHSLDDYRRRHATYKSDADLRACHAAHPWIVTWDDHEVENDYAGDASPTGLSPEAFLKRRTAAYAAYFEHMPLAPHRAPVGPSLKLYDSHAWGRLANLWTLDNRQYRSVQACPDARGAGGRTVVDCASLADPTRTMLGADQEQWLTGEFGNSRGRWRLIAQSTQISPGGVDTPSGRRVSTDSWDGYPAARDRLLGHIAAARLDNVVCLGGDVHRNVAGTLRLRPGDRRSPAIASEIVCTSVTSHGGSTANVERMLASHPDIVHARTGESGYAAIDIDRAGVRCEFRTAKFPIASDVSLTPQAEVVIELGCPGVMLA